MSVCVRGHTCGVRCTRVACVGGYYGACVGRAVCMRVWCVGHTGMCMGARGVRVHVGGRGHAVRVVACVPAAWGIRVHMWRVGRAVHAWACMCACVRVACEQACEAGLQGDL